MLCTLTSAEYMSSDPSLNTVLELLIRLMGCPQACLLPTHLETDHVVTYHIVIHTATGANAYIIILWLDPHKSVKHNIIVSYCHDFNTISFVIAALISAI